MCVSVGTHGPERMCGGQRTIAGVGPNLLSWDQDLLVLLWCQDSWPSDFQWFSCFCLPSHCRSTEITGVHTIASGFNMGFGNLNPGPHTCRSTLTYGVNPRLALFLNIRLYYCVRWADVSFLICTIPRVGCNSPGLMCVFTVKTYLRLFSLDLHFSEKRLIASLGILAGCFNRPETINAVALLLDIVQRTSCSFLWAAANYSMLSFRASYSTLPGWAHWTFPTGSLNSIHLILVLELGILLKGRALARPQVWAHKNTGNTHCLSSLFT